MAIHRAPEDTYVKEMAKWEQRDVLVSGTFIQAIPVAEGGRKDAPFSAYPKAMYQAESADGGPRISNFRIVPDESAELLAKGSGWFARQEDALADVPRRQLELATLAANRLHNERWMSDKSKAEAAAIDETTMQHLAEIPETPIRRRPGRPPKGAA